MQRAGRIGRNEFDQDGLTLTTLSLAVTGACIQDAARRVLLGARVDANVDEAGTGDFRAGQPLGRRQCRDQFGGDFTRVALQDSGQLHGGRAGEVAVLRLLRALQRNQ